MGVNLFGVMLGTQRAARHMAEHGGGSIINTASIAGINAGAGPIVYRVSKAAVVQFSRSIAIDLAPIRHPRELHRAGAHPHRHHQLRHGPGDPVHAAAAAHGEPADVAEAVLYLASDRPRRSPGSCCRSTAGRLRGRRSPLPSALIATAPRKGAPMSADIVIRGGTVVDGTGAPGRRGRRRDRAAA